jgi:hypothetical protein
MANIRKSFNFRNGVQVDNDNFVVNANGLVGIGTTIPEQLLDVRGDARISGILTVSQIVSSDLSLVTANISNKLNVGIVSIVSGVVTSSSSTGIITYFGDGGNLINLPTSQWIDVDPGFGYTSIYSAGNVGVGTTFPNFSFQVGGDPNFSNGLGINSEGGVYSTGIITAGFFNGDGFLVTNITADNITSGTLSANRLPTIPNSNLPSNISVSGIITAQSGFVGNVTGDVNSSGLSTFSGGIIGSVTGDVVGNVTGNVNSSGVSTFSGGIIGNVTGDVNSSGLSTFSGGIIGNVTGNVIGDVIGNITGDIVGIADTARDLTSDARVTIDHINSQTSESGINTISSRLDVFGTIGINTDSPQSDIHIVNDSEAYLQLTGPESTIIVGNNLNPTENSGGIKFGNQSLIYEYSTSNSLDIINYDEGNLNYYLSYGFGSAGTGNFNWIYAPDASNPLMSLTYDGNLGIGITDPTDKLEVAGNTIIRQDLTVDQNLNVNENINVDQDIVAIGAGSSVSVDTLYVYGGKSRILNPNGTEMFPDNGEGTGISTFSNITVLNNAIIDGKIGIGNTAPLEFLHIGGDYLIDPEDALVATASGIGIGTTSIRFGLGIDAESSDAIFGTVGIGTTDTDSTQVRLYVNGPSIFAGNLSISGVTTSIGGFNSGAGNAVQITTSGNQLIFNVPGVGTTSLTLF